MPTLYISGYGTSAQIEGERILITHRQNEGEDWKTSAVHLREVSRAVVVGTPAVKMSVIHALLKRGVPIHLLDYSGHWLGSLNPSEHGDITRRLRQYELAKDLESKLRFAVAIVSQKIRNCRRTLQRLAANRSQSQDLEHQKTLKELRDLEERTSQAKDLDEVRGYEGMASAIYFSRLRDFFPDDLPFEYRSRRPPHNPANALLSWSYSIILTEIDTQIRIAGLDPYIGFLHEISYGRPSLSLDLLEVYRAPIGDLLTLKLLNHRVLQKSDFYYDGERGGYYLEQTGRSTFFVEYERTMERLFHIDSEESHVSFRGCIAKDVKVVLQFLEDPLQIPQFFQMP